MLGTSTSFTPTCFLLISYFPKGDSFIWQTYNAAISRSFFRGRRRSRQKLVLRRHISLYTVTLLRGYSLKIIIIP